MSSELERAAAACLLPSFEGVDVPDWVRRWLDRGLIGVVLFGRNIETRGQVAALTAALRREREEVLVATDEEGGDVTRLEARTGSSYPSHWGLGVVDDPPLTSAVAASIAADLAEVGVNWDFAPVADVNSNPDNPVIGIRSFGADPALVARHVAAFVDGLQGRRVAACAKHFPGHGDTAQDSHLELPVSSADPATALEPFRAAVAAGVRSVMTAHVRVPALDEEQATLSRRILHGVLRDELGFAGVAVTDALEMQAVSATIGMEQGAVRALAAGADALCIGAEIGDRETAAVHGAIVDAVASGALPEERLHEAAARVASLAAWARPVRGHAGGGAGAAERALRVEGDAALTAPPFVLDLHPPASIAAGPAEHGFADLLGDAVVVRVEPPGADTAELLVDLDGRQPVVVVRDAHRHEWQRRAVETVLARAPDAVVIEVGLPLWRPDGARGYIATHGGGRASFAAAASALSASSSTSDR